MPWSTRKTARRSKKAPKPGRAPTRATTTNTAVKDVTRPVPWGVKLKLAVRAGGRCEFPGCNQPLFEHRVTLADGNFSEFAHIVAFSRGGPRGADSARPRDLHNLANLLLLCQQCHKLIDDRPDDYPRAVLESFKTEHEERIHHVTGLAPDQRTVVVQLKARINGDAVDIPFPDVTKAVAPRYPTDRRGHVIDLTPLHVVRIEYRRGTPPTAFIEQPALRRRAEKPDEPISHTYEWTTPGRERPCVFFPREDWDATKPISRTIIPWLMAWLVDYELWHATGEWTGGGRHPGE